MPWFVLYTKSRSEKLVANALQKKGIDVYCPLMKRQKQWSDRIKIVEEPLFKSYCFVNLREEERSLVFDVSGVVRYLFWLKKPAIVKQAEIDIIKDMLNDFDHGSIEVVSLSVADRIRIDSGAFIDHEAEVVSTQGRNIIAKIDSLGICIAIDKSKNKIKKIQATA
ncbi:antitermination protein NusG [Runella rosea]|uniref:Antitermination protein NusG n=1 Tax=Runella rosea TaxID=2259595 RepID=A0A344TPC0_9BACT|nr:UpxY family transcription antiterminator [Runella rosea]AXE20491.1 antitermination protein NusG [Runella rosea]